MERGANVIPDSDDEMRRDLKAFIEKGAIKGGTVQTLRASDDWWFFEFEPADKSARREVLEAFRLAWHSALFTSPGGALGSILLAIFGKRVHKRLLEQHIVDHAEEWTEAHAHGQLRLARWIQVRCWIVLLWTVLGALPIEQIRGLLFGGAKSSKSAKDE